ncbi:uncharacterized protein LOC133190759 [Saccostrea echinata]|uniref:uncharacterized protein LOC133190759 n=1 Tax=Saccostrea echinata TaxID=191078 RepID=UPI002A82049E|nr:uncharacterized protein LOC133190759 [Saccostrea echinata]
MLRRRRTVIITLGILCSVAVFLLINLYWQDRGDEKVTRSVKTERRTIRDYIDSSIHDSFYVHQFDRKSLKLTKTAIDYNSENNAVNIFQYQKLKSAPCVPFQTWRGMIKICTHNPKQDTMISAFVHEFATWEQDFLNATGDILTKNPHITFVDLGCNIGVYTLFAAKLGISVVSVDIFYKNLALLSESLEINSLKENVTLVHNAISDQRQNVTIEVVENNIGGSYVKPLKNDKMSRQIIIGSIFMDDLIPLIKTKDVFVKMDIEGTELKALKAAKNFLQAVNVKGILMEWVLHKNNPSAKEIIEIMTDNWLMPYWDHQQLVPLKIGAYTYWPDNVFWIKR